jgi:hypothetical protein
MVKCVSNKKSYPTKEIAENALLDTHMNFEFKSGDGPIAVYLCEDCGNYHFTSRGPMNIKLEQLIKEGKINAQRQANAWMDKFKRR